MQGMMPAGGMPAPAPAPAMPMPMPIPNSPSVPPAAINNPSMPLGSGNFFQDIMKAIFDPSGAAKDMAASGLTPEQFTEGVKTGNLANVMGAQKRPAGVGDVYTRDGLSVIQSDLMRPLADRPNQPPSSLLPTMPDVPMLSDLMQPIGQSQDTAAIRQASIMGNTGQATPIAPPVIPPLGVGQAQQPIVPPIMPPVAQSAGVADGSVLPVPPPQTVVGQDMPVSSVAPQQPFIGQPAASSPNATLATVGGEQLRSNPTAGAARFSASGMRPEIREMISKKAQQYGLDPGEMQRIAMIESGGNPKAQNPNSSAGGVYQFIDDTWKNYGMGKNKMDAEANIDAGMRLAVDTRDFLRAKLGREPTYAEIYLGHQQGMGGASKLLANPDAKATSLVSPAAVTGNLGKSDWSAKQFTDLWRDRYNNFGGGGKAGAEGTIAGSAGSDYSSGAVAGGAGLGTGVVPPVGAAAPTSATSDLMGALDSSGGSSASQDLNLPDAPSPVAPRPGGNPLSADVMKTILAMLAPQMGGNAMQIPTLAQLMSGR